MLSNEGHCLLDELAASLPRGMADQAGGSGRRLGFPDDAAAAGVSALDQVQAQVDKFFANLNSNLKMQKELVAKNLQRERVEKQRAAAREHLKKEAEDQEEDDAAAQQQTAELEQRIREQMQSLGVDLEELRESEQVLAPLPARGAQGPADMDLDGGYLEALAAAAEELGLASELLGEGVQQEAFLCAVRSGFVLTMTLRRGWAGRPLVDALLTVMSQSPDAETAGAAFAALMTLLGDAGSSSSSGGGGSGGEDGTGGGASSSGSSRGVDLAAAGLLLDAQYGLPAGVAAGSSSGGSGGALRLPPCRLDFVPTVEQLLVALQDNGYEPKGTSGGVSGSRGSRQQQQLQQQAAGPAGGDEQQQQQQEAEGLCVRLQPVKLLLHTAAAVCRYCRKHPEAAAGALGREGVCELLLAALHMGLDPCASQLQEVLDAAVPELLDALDEADWQRKLPLLAGRLLEMGPSHRVRFKLLRKLPASRPRGLALQQFSGSLLLEQLLPAGGGKQGGGRQGGGSAPGRSALNRREAAALDVTAVISAQRWFGDAKGLVTGATSGGAVQAPRGGYLIGSVELLLKVANMLLWPHMLCYAAGEASCLSESFLASWHGFLVGIQKHIKSMQPEDQAVRALAGYLDMEYQSLAEGMAEVLAGGHEQEVIVL